MMISKRVQTIIDEIRKSLPPAAAEAIHEHTDCLAQAVEAETHRLPDWGDWLALHCLERAGAVSKLETEAAVNMIAALLRGVAQLTEHRAQLAAATEVLAVEIEAAREVMRRLEIQNGALVQEIVDLRRSDRTVELMPDSADLRRY